MFQYICGVRVGFNIRGRLLHLYCAHIWLYKTSLFFLYMTYIFLYFDLKLWNNLFLFILQVVDKYIPSVNLSVEYYCLIILVPLCLLCQVRYLKFLAIFSMLANIFLVLTYFICLYYIFGGEISFADKKVVGNPARFPAFLS